MSRSPSDSPEEGGDEESDRGDSITGAHRARSSQSQTFHVGNVDFFERLSARVRSSKPEALIIPTIFYAEIAIVGVTT